jgi:hypothetical protein
MHKGWKREAQVPQTENCEGVETGSLLTERERTSPGLHGRRSMVVAGGSPVGERETPDRDRECWRTESLWLGRAGGLFLKRDMGAPDSLQCLSGAHRIAHSSCPVNHQTAHRKTDF